MRNYFNGTGLRRTLETSCSEELKTRLKCDGEKFIFCVLNQRNQMTNDYYCEHLLQRIEILSSLNYAFISDFPTLCKNDIDKLCNPGNREDESVVRSVLQ